uniref:hypothetical protein n=1 Tax=Pseudomonas viridiflava TaxID=33069 RepID=UPI00197DD3A0
DDISLNGTTFSSFGITPSTGNDLNLEQTLIWKKIPMVKRHVKALTSNTGRIMFQTCIQRQQSLLPTKGRST